MSTADLSIDAVAYPEARALAMHAEPLYFHYDPPSPERVLAAAVVHQALCDALSPQSTYRCWRSTCMDARDFFEGWRLESWCHVLGIEASRIREEYRRRAGLAELAEQEVA